MNRVSDPLINLGKAFAGIFKPPKKPITAAKSTKKAGLWSVGIVGPPGTRTPVRLYVQDGVAHISLTHACDSHITLVTGDTYMLDVKMKKEEFLELLSDMMSMAGRVE